MKHDAYLLLGGNIGDRRLYLEEGMEAIADRCGAIMARSAFYETAAWGKEDQQSFLNAAVHIETLLSPKELLENIALIERQLGRQREEVWGARTLDIDILFYDEVSIQTPDLTIPHPFIQDRRFVLVPMAEIAPDLLHPLFKKTISVLLEDCPDRLPVTALP